jgi:hypothetical protein
VWIGFQGTRINGGATLRTVAMSSNTQIREALLHARELVVKCKAFAGKQTLWVGKCDASLQEIDAAIAALDAQSSGTPKKKS